MSTYKVLKGRFRYKDSDGEWHSVDAIKGDRGPRGYRGASPTLVQYKVKFKNASAWQNGLQSVACSALTSSTEARVYLDTSYIATDKSTLLSDYSRVFNFYTEDGYLTAELVDSSIVPEHYFQVIVEVWEASDSGTEEDETDTDDTDDTEETT